MAVVIRMKRAGAKKRPFYRVVVANSRSPRDGRYIEQLGYYDPLTNPATFQIDADKVALWISRGALPSESVGVMVAKHAPQALLRAHERPVPPIQESAGMMPADVAPEPKKAKAPRKKAAPAKAKAKAVKKAKASTKGSEKKAHTRAKAKARKASGVAEKRATKKAKKKKS